MQDQSPIQSTVYELLIIGYRCAYDVHNYDAHQHRAGQIIFPLTLQTITTAQMLSVGGEGKTDNIKYLLFMYKILQNYCSQQNKS